MRDEIADGIDKELEMMLNEERLNAPMDESDLPDADERLDRRVYFRELFRLQQELSY